MVDEGLDERFEMGLLLRRIPREYVFSRRDCVDSFLPSLRTVMIWIYCFAYSRFGSLF